MAVSDFNKVTGNPVASAPRTTFTPIYNSATMQVLSSNIGVYWREANHFCADITTSFIAASSAQVITFTLPAVDGVQLTINSSLTSGRGRTHFTAFSMAGPGDWMDLSGGGYRLIQPNIFSGTEIRFYNNVGQLSGTDIAAGDALKYFIKVPVYEW